MIPAVTLNCFETNEAVDGFDEIFRRSEVTASLFMITRRNQLAVAIDQLLTEQLWYVRSIIESHIETTDLKDRRCPQL